MFFKQKTTAWIAVLLILGCTSFACRRSPEAREAAYLKRAREYFEKKDYTRATLELRNAASLMPKDAEPHYQMGLVYLATKSMGPAVGALRKAIQLNPKHSAAQLKLAELMIASRNQGLMTQAATMLQSVLESSPDNPDANDALATVEASTGKPQDAEKRLEDVLKKFPSHLQSSVVLTRLKLAQNDRKAAEEVLTRAVASSPNSPLAVQAMGEFYLMVNRRADAEAQFQKALQLDPKNAYSLLRLAALQMAGGRQAEAEQSFKTLSSLPDKSYRHIHATYLYSTGKKDAALQELESLNRNDPDDRAVRGRLIGTYIDMNRPKDAEKLVAAALKKNPKDTDALLQSSGFDLKAGNAAQAAEKLHQALKLAPDSARIHFALSVVSAAQGQPLTERSELNAALGLDRALLPARIALARNLRAGNEAKTALQVLDQAPQSQQKLLGVIVERHWVLLTLGRDKELRANLDQLLKINRNSELLLQDAFLKMREKDYAGAGKSAEEVLFHNPTDIRAAQLVADSYSAAKEPQKGLRRLSELAAGHPDAAPLQALLGEFEARAGHLPEARQAFERAKAADASFVGADIALAGLDRRENHADAARQRLTALVTADPKNLPAQLSLASMAEEANDEQSAIDRYRAVLTAAPSNVGALNNLAYHLATVDPDEALKYAQQAAEIAPQNAAVQDTIGWVYYRKGVYKSAVGYLKSAVEKEPTPRRQFHLAMGYLKLGDQSQGSHWLQTALRADPNLTKTERGW